MNRFRIYNTYENKLKYYHNKYEKTIKEHIINN